MKEIQDIPISSLFVDQRNVRHGDDVKVDNLAEDIDENGVLQPIVVRPLEDGYGVVAGSRRFKASQKAGLDSMPCIVRDLDDDRAVAVSVLENHSREDVEPRDQVKAIEKYFKESDRVWTDKDKKDKLTKSVSEGGFGFPQGTATEYINILAIDEEVREEYDLSVDGDNAHTGEKKELSIKQARKVGREMKEFSAEEQKKVIQEIEDKSFEDSKQLIDEVTAQVKEGEFENLENALEFVDMDDRVDNADVVYHDDIDSDFIDRCRNIAKNSSLSKKQKLLAALNLELPEFFDVDDKIFKKRASCEKDIYFLYLSICELKNKYPNFFFNGREVITIEKLIEYSQKAEDDLKLRESLEKWGEIALKEKIDSENPEGLGFANTIDNISESSWSDLGLSQYDQKRIEHAPRGKVNESKW